MTVANLKRDAVVLFSRKQLFSFGLPLLISAYLIYVFFAFDILGLANRARMDNARTLIADAYSYKTHVSVDNRSGALTVAIEGERKGTYPDGQLPSWVTRSGDQVVVDLGDSHVITLGPGANVTYDLPGYGQITAKSVGRSVETNQTGDIPEWMNLSKNRLAITTDAGRLTVTRNKTEVYRYFTGWELFFFTLDSPYSGHGVIDLFFGPRLDPDRSNLGGMWQDFWSNAMWRHSEVAWAIFETILMAFLGTFSAAILALPLAFAAAKNFAPVMALRFVVRRVFDFLRGVDGLIWTILLSRAFGPGPLTGSLAILLTDTGSFGKMFSEALENVDEKQIEGVASTGAKPLQRYRFGVIPQLTPVLLSQILYYLESNTRSATIIGAITGGGIGLLLTQAIITQKDWEEVSYYIVLVILMVMLMDGFSGWLRRRLIKGGDDGR